jgi:hypothetical protein
MKKTVIAAALLSALSMNAFAQTTNDNNNTPAIATPSNKPAIALVEGENSFTEAQAKDRITKAGFTDVSALKLDDKGVWRGTAMKDGKSSAVGIDYQGNVAAQ